MPEISTHCSGCSKPCATYNAIRHAAGAVDAQHERFAPDARALKLNQLAVTAVLLDGLAEAYNCTGADESGDPNKEVGNAFNQAWGMTFGLPGVALSTTMPSKQVGFSNK